MQVLLRQDILVEPQKKPSKLIYPVTADTGQERGKYSFQWLKIVFPYAH